MKPLSAVILRICLSLIGGALLALAFPPWYQAWLLWFCFIPVFAGLLLFRCHWVAASVQGALFTAMFSGAVFFWLLQSGRQADWLWNVASYALVGAVWGWIVGGCVRLPDKVSSGSVSIAPILPGRGFSAQAWRTSVAHLKIALFVAAAWTSLEWARGALLPGWNAIGTALQSNLPLLQLASITGISGLSFMVVFANLIALTTIRRIFIEPGRMTWAARFDVTSTLGVIFLVAVIGFQSLQKNPAANQAEKIGIVTSGHADAEALLAQTRPAGGEGIDLLVWPSAKIVPADYSRFADASLGKTIGLVAGVTPLENGAISGVLVLIPGEVKNVIVISRHSDFFQPSLQTRSRALIPFQFKDVGWASLLNWEAGDPLLVRGAVKKGVQVLIAFVDPTLGTPVAARQIFANLRVWATASGRPVVFSAPRNFYAIVTGSGRITAKSALDEGLLAGRIEVPVPFETTIYSRYGDWFATGCGAIALVLAISERLRLANEKSGRISA